MLRCLKRTVLLLSVLFLTSIGVCFGETNVELVSLKVDQEGLNPNFDPLQTNYSLFVSENINSINVEAVANDTSSKVNISGNDNLQLGDNTILIEITDKNGEKKDYTIIVTKTLDKDKSDSYLQNLIVENMELTPPFVPQTFSYDLGSVPYKINNIAVFAAANQNGAKVDISGNEKLNDGKNVIKINVTSEDGTTKKEYTLTLDRETEEQAITDVVETSQSISNTSEDSSKTNYTVRILIFIIIILVIFIMVLIYKFNKSKSKE